MRYLMKKLFTLIMTLFLVSAAVFLAFQVIPGDVVQSLMGTEGSPEREAQLRMELGLDKSAPEQYVHWISGVVKGDFGVSYVYTKGMNKRMPVAELIAEKLPVTLWLAFLSVMIVLLVGLPLGVFWAKYRGGPLDVLQGIFCQSAMAMPGFFIGILVTYLFGILFHAFQPGAYVSYQTDLKGFLAYLLFPAISVAVPKIAMTARFLRNAMLEELQADYVRTAASKGCSEEQILRGHVLRNAFMPVITFLGMIVVTSIASTIVVEQVFSLPGIGRLLISSISNRDFPVVEVLILYITSVVIVVYALVDVLYNLVDPRVNTDDKA